ncbi:MAG: N-acetyltransferase [Paludibacter sp.]|nr:N-acetyltransferase [Bacteroidales bacterium]MCM1068476.1 N-acetyltransferase [Prevotella sp.]MCM1353430.1 N-acetyltransferase [Bacteroides sp.]MCM1442591.1 N-acetyltransferase [Muribaculum sp.]MCM1481436.1 N-acetyltransferase [Paludibacter sp.]
MKISYVKTESGGLFRAFETEEPYRPMGEMTYVRQSPDIMIIDHTQTFRGFEGKGVGRRLVEAGITYAKNNNMRIRPLCSFARAYISKFPDLQQLVVE